MEPNIVFDLNNVPQWVELVNRLRKANKFKINGGWLDASQDKDLLSMSLIKPKAHEKIRE